MRVLVLFATIMFGFMKCSEASEPSVGAEFFPSSEKVKTLSPFAVEIRREDNPILLDRGNYGETRVLKPLEEYVTASQGNVALYKGPHDASTGFDAVLIDKGKRVVVFLEAKSREFSSIFTAINEEKVRDKIMGGVEDVARGFPTTETVLDRVQFKLDRLLWNKDKEGKGRGGPLAIQQMSRRWCFELLDKVKPWFPREGEIPNLQEIINRDGFKFFRLSSLTVSDNNSLSVGPRGGTAATYFSITRDGSSKNRVTSDSDSYQRFVNPNISCLLDTQELPVDDSKKYLGDLFSFFASKHFPVHTLSRKVIVDGDLRALLSPERGAAPLSVFVMGTNSSDDRDLVSPSEDGGVGSSSLAEPSESLREEKSLMKRMDIPSVEGFSAIACLLPVSRDVDECLEECKSRIVRLDREIERVEDIQTLVDPDDWEVRIKYEVLPYLAFLDSEKEKFKEGLRAFAQKKADILGKRFIGPDSVIYVPFKLQPKLGARVPVADPKITVPEILMRALEGYVSSGDDMMPRIRELVGSRNDIARAIKFGVDRNYAALDKISFPNGRPYPEFIRLCKTLGDEGKRGDSLSKILKLFESRKPESEETGPDHKRVKP